MTSSGTYVFGPSNGECVLAAFERVYIRAPELRQEHIRRCGRLAEVPDLCYISDMEDGPLIIVYQAVNKINGKRYIGMTARGLRVRSRGHRASARAGYEGAFNRALRKYGAEHFEFSILEACVDTKTALRRERELIEQHKPQYNIAAGGLSGPQGWKHSEESRKRMSESRKGKPSGRLGATLSAESIAKRTASRALNPSRYWLGKKRSPETVAKIAASRPFWPTPKAPTPETLEIWLTNMRGANKKRMKAIRCLTDGVVYESMKAAVRFYGMKHDTLQRALRDKRPVAGGAAAGLSFEWCDG